MAKDFYDTLGISKTATQDEIKAAYKKMAIKYHPDRNQDKKEESEKKMKEINEAYDTLGDPNKRQNYDRFGSSGQNGGFGGQGGFSGGFNQGFSGFEDIFEDINSMFGGASSRSRRERSDGRQKGSDLRYTVKLTLKEAYLGIKKNISFKALGKCDQCNAKGGEGVITCSECDGAGTIRYQQGFFIVENTCPKCRGDGIMIKNPCRSCKGSGRKEKEFNITVDIPRGVSDSDNIRVSQSGEAGIRGGQSGDLFVAIKITEDDFFRRDGDNLICDIPVKFTRAILGGEIAIPLIDGTIHKLNISEGIQNGDRIKVSSKGMPRYNSNNFGDLFIYIKIETPINLSKDQKRIVEELDRSIDDKMNPKTNNFINKIKSLFN